MYTDIVKFLQELQKYGDYVLAKRFSSKATSICF